MRRSVTTLAASALAAGVVALTPGAAHATAPAPTCESGASTVICDASSTGTTTWYVTLRYTSGSVNNTYVTSGSFVRFSCSTSTSVSVYYSFDAGGHTEYSGTDNLLCNHGPWQ